MHDLKCVFRSISLPVATFDHLKQFQREYERQHEVKLTNSQAIALILHQHKEMLAGGKRHG